jgi:hypothetical protein
MHASDAAPIFAAIERNFPGESGALIDQLLEIFRAHGANLDEATSRGLAIMQSFVRSKNANLLNATASSLMTLNARELAFYRALWRSDVRLCALHFQGGVRDTRGIPAAMRPLFVDITVAIIDAAGDGSRSALVPHRREMLPEQVDAFWAEIQELDTTGEVMPIWRTPGAIQNASPQIQCQVGLLFHDAIGRLEPETGANMFVALLEPYPTADADPATTR